GAALGDGGAERRFPGRPGLRARRPGHLARPLPARRPDLLRNRPAAHTLMVAAAPLPSTPPAAMEIAPPRRAGKAELFLLVLRQHKLFALGYFLVASIIILALAAPLIAPFDPEEANASI